MTRGTEGLDQHSIRHEPEIAILRILMEYEIYHQLSLKVIDECYQFQPCLVPISERYQNKEHCLSLNP